jgi:hypothetical protein
MNQINKLALSDAEGPAERPPRELALLALSIANAPSIFGAPFLRVILRVGLSDPKDRRPSAPARDASLRSA